MNDGESGPDDVLAEVVERGVRQRIARQAQLDDRDVGRAIAQNQRRRDVARHVLQHDQRELRQLRDGAAHVRAFVQIDLDDADADVAVGFDAGDVVDQRGQLPLVKRQDAVLHVRRAHAVVGPDDADDRNVDFREDVDRHALRRAPASRHISAMTAKIV